jgi:PKD domain-containing protein
VANNFLRIVTRATLVLLLAATTAQADCVSSIKQVSDFFTSPNRAAGAIVWTGSTLGVVLNETLPPRSIYFSAYDANLNQVIGDKLVATSSRDGAFRVFFHGNGYGVFYFDPSGQLTLQKLTSGGDAFDAPIPVGANATFPDQEADVTFDPTRNAYIIVHSITQGASVGFWITIVGVDGTTLSDDRLTFELSSPSEPRVAVAADGTIAVLRHQREANDGLRLSVLNANHAVAAFADLSSNARLPVLASNGAGFAVVWQSTIAGGTELRWARVNTQAQVLISETRLISGRGTDVAPVSLIWNPNGSEFALSYLDSAIGFAEFPGDFRLRRFTVSGALISDTAFASDPSRVAIGGRYPFVWTGQSYVSSAERFVANQGSISFLELHCTLASAITASRITVSAGSPVTLTASASGGTAPFSFVWDFGDLSDKRTEATVQHTYVRPGTYTVTLTTTDAANATSVSTMTITVFFPKRRPVGR